MNFLAAGRAAPGSGFPFAAIGHDAIDTKYSGGKTGELNPAHPWRK